MVPFNVQPKGGSFLQKELSFINFPNGHPASFNIQTIKLFSFEAHHVITLVNFSLLQLLSVLTLSDPHLSIILHVIREILYIPFIFANSCIFFSSTRSRFIAKFNILPFNRSKIPVGTQASFQYLRESSGNFKLCTKY